MDEVTVVRTDPVAAENNQTDPAEEASVSVPPPRSRLADEPVMLESCLDTLKNEPVPWKQPPDVDAVEIEIDLGDPADKEAPETKRVPSMAMMDERSTLRRRDMTMATNLVGGLVFALAMAQSFASVNSPSALNYIETGDVDTTNANSQRWFYTCNIVGTVLGFVFSEVWAQGGGWWGRKRIIVLLTTFVWLNVVLAFVGTLLKAPFLHVVAACLGGLCTGLGQASMAYVADLSTTSNFSKNVGVLGVWGCFGVVAGMLIIVFVEDVTLGYIVPGVILGLVATLAQFFVPDISPPRIDRIPWSSKTVGWAFVPWAHVHNFRAQTMYTRCLLASLFFASASFSTIAMWLFTYGLVKLGMTRMICGLFALCVFFSGAAFVGIGTRVLSAKKGTFALMWLTPSFALWMCFGPPRPQTMFIGLVFLFPNHVVGSLIQTLYYGQQAPGRRAELAGLSNIAGQFGGLMCLFTAPPLTIAWQQAHDDGGEGTVPPPPALTAAFNMLSAIMFYIAYFCFSHQDLLKNTIREDIDIPAAGVAQEPSSSAQATSCG